MTYQQYLAQFGLPDHPNVKRDWALQYGSEADKAAYQPKTSVDPVALDTGGGAKFGAGGSPLAPMPVRVSAAQHAANQGSTLDKMRRENMAIAETNFRGAQRAMQEAQMRAGGAIDQRTGVVTPFAEVRNADGSLVNPKAAAAAAAAPPTTAQAPALPGAGSIARPELAVSDVTNREAASLAELEALRQRVAGQDVDAKLLADQGLAQQIAAARSTGGTASQRAGAGFAASQSQPLIAAQATDAAARTNAANSGLLADITGQKVGARDSSIKGQGLVDEQAMKASLAGSTIGLQSAQQAHTAEQTKELQRRYDMAMRQYLDSKDERSRAEAYGILTTLGGALGTMAGGPVGGALAGGVAPVVGKLLGVDKWL